MKKQHLLKSMLLLCALVAGSGSVWATTAKLTITSKPSSSSETLTDDGSNSWSFTSDGTVSGSETTLIHVGTNSSPVSYIKLNTSAFTSKRITKVQVWAAAKASTSTTTKITIGTTLLGKSSELTNTTSSGGTEFSVDVTDKVTGNLEIEISRPSKTNGAIYFVKAIVTYETTEKIVITNAGYATFSSCFEVAIPSGVTAYYANLKDASTVSLKEITGDYIPANEGVVVAGDEGNYSATITSTSASAITGNLLKPQLKAGTPSESTYYTLAAGPTFKVSTGGTLAAGKAYLVPSGSSANELTVDFGEGNVTGITDIKNNMSDVNCVIYDLSGRKVSQPTKGLYIVNGKKVLIK